MVKIHRHFFQKQTCAQILVKIKLQQFRYRRVVEVSIKKKLDLGQWREGPRAPLIEGKKGNITKKKSWQGKQNKTAPHSSRSGSATVGNKLSFGRTF